MRIKRKIYDLIVSTMPETPPETGGIIGGKDEVISVYQIDDGIVSLGCSYKPDVDKLNMVIEKWKADDIRFYGLFHTHFFDVRTLSEGDICYIKVIMEAMPDFIQELYFPIVVMPEREMVWYKALKGEDIGIIKVNVEFDEISGINVH